MKEMYKGIITGCVLVAATILLAPRIVDVAKGGKDAIVVKSMKACLEERKPQSVTEEQIGYSHRLCWMRAQKATES